MYGDRIAIVVSAVTFGIFHGNFSQLFYATALGFLLAYVYSKSANVKYTIVIHMLINFTGSVLTLILYKSTLELTELLELAGENQQVIFDNLARYTQLLTVSGSLSFLRLTAIVLGLVFLVKRRKQFFVSDRCEVFIPKDKRLSTIAINAGGILFLIFSVTAFVLSILEIGQVSG
jgi:membrane protease YdiL (CAAX protease family)